MRDSMDGADCECQRLCECRWPDDCGGEGVLVFLYENGYDLVAVAYPKYSPPTWRQIQGKRHHFYVPRKEAFDEFRETTEKAQEDLGQLAETYKRLTDPLVKLARTVAPKPPKHGPPPPPAPYRGATLMATSRIPQHTGLAPTRRR